jgi:hypothetical protein
MMWYLALCTHCMPLAEQPFTDSEERDQWIAAHRTSGHTRFIIDDVPDSREDKHDDHRR